MSEDLEENKSHDESDQSWWCRAHLRTKVGIGISGLYLLGIYVTVSYRYADFSGLKLNEIGDFLAGVFAPLALLWLVIGYFQQGDELRQNSQALLLQAEELRQAAEHAGGILEVARQEHELAIIRLNAEKELRAAAEKEADAAAQKFKKKKIQPRFIHEKTDLFGDIARILIKNHGQRCKDFSIEVPHNKLIYLNSPVIRNEIGPLMTTEFNIQLLNRGEVGDTRMIFRWVDSEGDRQEENFVVALLQHSLEIKSERL